MLESALETSSYILTATVDNILCPAIENTGYIAGVTVEASVQALEATWSYIQLVVEGLVEGAIAGAQLAQTGLQDLLTSQLVENCLSAVASAAGTAGQLGGQLVAAGGRLVKDSLR